MNERRQKLHSATKISNQKTLTFEKDEKAIKMKLIIYTAIIGALFCTVSFSAPSARIPRQTTACSAPNNDYEAFLKIGLRILDNTLNVRLHFKHNSDDSILYNVYVNTCMPFINAMHVLL